MSVCQVTCKAIIYMAVGTVWLLITPHQVWLLFEGSDVCITEHNILLLLGLQHLLCILYLNRELPLSSEFKGTAFGRCPERRLCFQQCLFHCGGREPRSCCNSQDTRPATRATLTLVGRLDMFGWAFRPRSLSDLVLRYKGRHGVHQSTAQHLDAPNGECRHTAE